MSIILRLVINHQYISNGDFSLMRIISESSILSPIDSRSVTFTLCYWSWLVKRRLFVKQLRIHNFSKNPKEMLDFCFVVKTFTPSNIKAISEINDRNIPLLIAMIENETNMSLCIFNRLESIIFSSSSNIYAINKPAVELKIISLICTNLKSLTIDGFSIDNDDASSILESNSHCLTQLTLMKFTGVIPAMNLLFANIKELKIIDCKNLSEVGWNDMLMGLKTLTHLTFVCFSMKMLRNTICPIIHGGAYGSRFSSAPFLPQSLTSLSCLTGPSVLFSMTVTKEALSKLALPSSLTELNMSTLYDIDDNTIIAMLSNNNLSNLTLLNATVLSHSKFKKGISRLVPTNTLRGYYRIQVIVAYFLGCYRNGFY
eukprot:gene9551-12863_t